MTSSIFASVTSFGSYSTCTVLAGISTVTVFTPSIFPTAPSMACWQCSQEISGAIRVVDSIRSFLLLLIELVTTLLISGNGVELDQFLNHRFFTVTLNSFWDTGTQMSQKELRVTEIGRAHV